MSTNAAGDARQARSPWPAGADGRRVLFLADVRSGFEYSLVRQWIQNSVGNAAQKPARDWQLLPLHRQRRGGRVVPEELPKRLNGGEDMLLVPIRLAWYFHSGDKKKGIRLVDLIHGDPGEPGRIRQRWVHWRHRDRWRFVLADPATVTELKERNECSQQAEQSSFAEYVVRQAVLALERAERRERGTRYKVPRLVNEDILARASFQQELASLAVAEGKTSASTIDEARGYLQEMAAAHRTLFIDLFARLSHYMYTRGFDSRLAYPEQELADIRDLTLQHPVVFLFTHKSYLDVPVLIHLFYDNDFPPAHLFGGINMNIFGLGALMRGAGLVFIRRSFKDNAIYKLVFQHYIDYLIEKRFPLMWSIEGTRSRSGKLMAPRLGLLSYVVEACRRTDASDMRLVPISIAYDQIPEVGEFSAEQKGGTKKAEDVNWMMRYLSGLKKPFGRIFVRFGEPVLLAESVHGVIPSKLEDKAGHQLLVQKTAFEVSDRINRVTPITATALVTLSLLGAGQRALTLREVSAEVAEINDWVRRRKLPTTDDLALDDLDGVERTLAALATNGVVASYQGGPETVYSVGPEQSLNAAYYRNTIIHFFINDALAELGFLLSSSESGLSPAEAFRGAVLELRDLFKFEFFYAAKPEFCDQVETSLTLRDAAWMQALDQDHEHKRQCLSRMRPLLAQPVLRSLVDAYVVVANVLLSYEQRPAIDEQKFINECLALGQQMYLQRRIASEESIAKAQYNGGWKLVCNRGLAVAQTMAGASARAEFALQLRRLNRHLDVIQSIAASRLSGD